MRNDVRLVDGHRFTGSQPDLELNQIHAVHLFGDGVLDLDPRIDLQEEELLSFDQELAGPHRAVARMSRQPDRCLPDAVPKVVGQVWSGRLLNQLLVATLQGAIPLPDMNRIAVGISCDLDLHVARRRQEALDEHGAVAEGGQRLRAVSSKTRRSVASSSATRIPLPPPPKAALTSTG